MGAAALLLAPSCLECESWSRLPGVPLGTWHLCAHAGLGMETLKLDLALAGWAGVVWGLRVVTAVLEHSTCLCPVLPVRPAHAQPS